MTTVGFRGTSQEQDPRFAEKQKKLLATTKFPDVFREKVDMRKVALEVVKPWITARVTEFMGFDDDVLSSYVASLLDDQNGTKPVDPRLVQINLSGFMEEHAAPFVERLWRLLLSAQTEVGGIPTEILEAKKAEIKAQLAEQQRIAAQVERIQAELAQPPARRAPVKYLGASKAEMDASAIGQSTSESHAEWQRKAEERERHRAAQQQQQQQRRPSDSRQRDRSRSPKRR